MTAADPTPLDLRDEIEALCRKLGINHDDTTKIILEPRKATAYTLTRNEAGAIIADHFGVATTYHVFDVARS